MTDTSARRPIQTRSAHWAQAMVRYLLRRGRTPNQISVASVVFATLAAICIFETPSNPYSAWLWLTAALCIQLRLICNLFDGMLAVEGGKGTADGDLYNETPDRLADILILASTGYACSHVWGVSVGWIAASGAVLTAYIRMHGATLTQHHDFCGPMAKPHRMAAMTALCLFLFIAHLCSPDAPWIASVQFWSLATIAVGTLVTFVRRLIRLSSKLHASS